MTGQEQRTVIWPATKQDTENGHVTRKSHHGVHEAGLLSDYHYFGT